MQKRNKKSARRVKAGQKMLKLVYKIREIEFNERLHNSLSTDISGPLSYWYTVLSRLSKSNLTFISQYRAADGHLFNVIVFREALNTLMLERAIGLDKDSE
jgi:hypothetical protein